MKRILTLSLSLFLLSGVSHAQTSDVHGLVVDEKGQPMAGVAVILAGTETAVITDGGASIQ